MLISLQRSSFELLYESILDESFVWTIIFDFHVNVVHGFSFLHVVRKSQFAIHVLCTCKHYMTFSFLFVSSLRDWGQIYTFYYCICCLHFMILHTVESIMYSIQVLVQKIKVPVTKQKIICSNYKISEINFGGEDRPHRSSEFTGHNKKRCMGKIIMINFNLCFCFKLLRGERRLGCNSEITTGVV